VVKSSHCNAISAFPQSLKTKFSVIVLRDKGAALAA
jgi:hypothetical protein